MAAAVRRRTLVYCWHRLPVFSADRFGVILVDLSTADTAEVDSKDDADDSKVGATVRGRLLPGDGGQIMLLGMASEDMDGAVTGSNAGWLASRTNKQLLWENENKKCRSVSRG